MAVHVSIHDVSPAWAPEVELALGYAHAVGAKPALLVVPNFHGRAPLTSDAAFCTRLRALQADGHEIYLHGFFHKSGPLAPRAGMQGGRPGLRWLFAQKIVSRGEAEFSDVSRTEAVARLDDGEQMLREAGLRVDGFVAPAWSMPPWLVPMLAERGCNFTEDHVRVYDPAGRRSRASLVLNFASRTPARLLSSVAFCRAATPLRAIVPARLAIHPADMRYALLRAEVKRLLAWAEHDLVRTGPELLHPE
jgi:predicted deacetylase